MADLGVGCSNFFTPGASFAKTALQEQKVLRYGLCPKLLIFDVDFFVTAVEVHLALLLLATVFRSSVGVRVLGQCLFAVKFLGFALGVYSGYSSGIHFSTLTDACSKDRIRFSSVSRS